jgi:hypothetical protein
MAGFKRNPDTGDLDLTEGLKIVTGSEDLVQRINLGLSVNLGEFFSHSNYGLPWLRNSEEDFTDVQYFLGEDTAVTAQYIVKEFDRYIESIDQVDSLISSFTFDRETRTLSYHPTITGNNGEVINFPPYLQQL